VNQVVNVMPLPAWRPRFSFTEQMQSLGEDGGLPEGRAVRQSGYYVRRLGGNDIPCFRSNFIVQNDPYV